MFTHGNRNIVALTGFLGTTENPLLRSIHQGVLADTRLDVRVPEGCTIPDMAPVDLSGPMDIYEGRLVVRADWIGPATAQSMAGLSNFRKVGDAPEEAPRIDFDPVGIEWKARPEIAEHFAEGPSTWGLEDLDAQAGWLYEGIKSPPKGKLMARCLLTGIPSHVGRRIQSADRIHTPMMLTVAPGVELPIRLYNEMRRWSSIARLLVGATSPITVTGMFRAKYDHETGGRIAFIEAADVYAACREDLPSGTPAWMLEAIRAANSRRSVDLERPVA